MRNYIFQINDNVIQIYNNVDIQPLRQYIININLKERWGVCQVKKQNLIFEMIIFCFKSRLSFIVFSDFHSMISCDKI